MMKIIGHRGARGLAPENTMASIKKALDHKVDMIEFDIRVTKDDVPILHHNPWIKINDQTLWVSKCTYRQLKEVFPAVTRLTEAIENIGNQAQIYAEVKIGVQTEPVIKALRSISRQQQSNLFLASKGQRTLAALHRGLPELPVIVIEPWSGLRAAYRARKLQTQFISMNQRWMWSGFIRAMVGSGYHLTAYTLNDPAKARRWQKLGLYGVVTDYPDRFN